MLNCKYALTIYRMSNIDYGTDDYVGTDDDDCADSNYVNVEVLKSYKGLQFVHLNARSLYHKVQALKEDILKPNIGVLGISETWLKASIPDSLLNAQNFSLVRNDRKRGRGGGTCMYVNNNLEYEIVHNAISNKDIEIQSLYLRGRKSSHHQKRIVVLLTYRPPNGNGINACNTIKEYIGTIEEIEKKEIVLMGDLNWDISDKESVGAKFVNDICDEFGLKQMINESTRITSYSNTLIDVIITNVKNIAYVGCLNYQISDHYPTYLVKNNRLYEKDVQKRNKFNRLVKLSRDSFYKDQLSLHKNNQVKFWQTVGDILSCKSTPKIDRVFRYGTVELCDEQSSVDTINEFFATVGERVLENMPNVEYKQLDPVSITKKGCFKLMNTNEFLELVKELNHTKSSGVDNINPI